MTSLRLPWVNATKSCTHNDRVDQDPLRDMFMYCRETAVPAQKYQSREPAAGKGSTMGLLLCGDLHIMTLQKGKLRHGASTCSGSFIGSAATWGADPWPSARHGALRHISTYQAQTTLLGLSAWTPC